MRDHKDPGTIEMHIPKKRGRPPINGEAMTPAEKQRRYRAERARASSAMGRPKEHTDTVLLDCIRRSLSDGSSARTIARLVDELAQRHGTAGAGSAQ